MPVISMKKMEFLDLMSCKGSRCAFLENFTLGIKSLSEWEKNFVGYNPVSIASHFEYLLSSVHVIGRFQCI